MSAALAIEPGAAIARVAERYAAVSRFDRGFVRGKLRGDPAVAAILALAARVPFGHVADLGCGRGQFGLLLLDMGLAESVAGFDLDRKKIARANRAASADPPARARFAVADLAEAPIPDCDTAMFLDVLVLMPPAAQDAALARAIAAVRRRILIRSFDPDRGWRSRFGIGVERARRLLGADPSGGAVSPRPVAVLTAPLEAAGFRVNVAPCWGATPLPNVLIVAERD